ncbi:hypothetical protein GK047_26165 [Paenibacillus sp. SYP-B3998]|uniref:Uncharacterized protein n=1 Tax=Paenibacillus sp. SYP-B3998 TaxID=2678564 RepID=A0A6G4A4X7_9BACL|nr:hypothetical protein [Paenibacillus sp. SYP-B3998]NEW09432.1 hypothetical protein [Paenibacillus sp. SYP-B3998]
MSIVSNLNEIFLKIPYERIKEHIKMILDTEIDYTKIVYKTHHDLNNRYYLFLLLRNDNEPFAHFHFFSSDSIDSKFGEYFYFSLPESDLKALLEFSKIMLLS